MNLERRRRIARLLEQDKEDMNAPSREAAAADFSRVANEYFEVNGEVGLTVSRDRKGFLVSVDFHALRVKNFTTFHGKSPSDD